MKEKEKRKISVLIDYSTYSELNKVLENKNLTTFRTTKGFLVDLALNRLFKDLRTIDIEEIITEYFMGGTVNENY